MIRLLAALVLAAVATGSWAQDIPVQSGEHATFTRLVLRIGAVEWRFGRIASGYRLILPEGGIPDIATVFDRVPRDRIADLRAEPGRLDLDLACACHAAVFVHDRDWLVIDIADGGPDARSSFEASMEVAAPPALRALPLFVPRSAPPLILPGLMEITAAQPQRENMIEARMAEGIRVAAEQGLLELVDAADPDVPASPPPPVTVAEPVLPRPPAGMPGLVTHGAMDGLLAGGLDALSDAGNCPTDEEMDLAAWAGSGDFMAETAAGWAALTDDRDRYLDAGVEDLARTYIAFGFGREAEQVLALAGADSRARQDLRLLARLVDGRPVAEDGLLRRADCGGPVILWRALAVAASGEVPSLSDRDRTAIETAYRLLPAQLRNQMTPRLAGLLTRSGDPLAGEEMLGRVEVETTSRLEMEAAAAMTALADDRVDSALERFDRIVATEPRLTPDLLVARLDLARAEGRAPGPDDLALLRAMRFEYRDRPEERSLASAESRVLSGLGRHADALAVAETLPPGERESAIDAAILALVSNSGEAEFLEVAVEQPPDSLPPRAANALAARLIDLGFPDVALSFLGPTTAGPHLADRRYLRAEAAALLGRSDLVEAELLGIDDERATAIRAMVPSPASVAGEPDWAELAASDDAVLRDMSSAALAAGAEQPEVGPLAAGTALIEAAETTRQAAQALIGRVAAP